MIEASLFLFIYDNLSFLYLFSSLKRHLSLFSCLYMIISLSFMSFLFLSFLISCIYLPSESLFFLFLSFLIDLIALKRSS